MQYLLHLDDISGLNVEITRPNAEANPELFRNDAHDAATYKAHSRDFDCSQAIKLSAVVSSPQCSQADMARILVTGSADGLGKLAAQSLVKQGHQVVVHARNEQRAKEAMAAVPGAETCLIADLSRVEEVEKMATDANKLGRFDSVIHNAGAGYQSSHPDWTPDGYAATFAINSLAPYILTCLMEKPDRLIYISSGLHRSGNSSMDVDKLTWKNQRWSGLQAYNDTKLQNVILANAVARRWGTGVLSNSVDPLWQPTKMGGAGAPGDLKEGTDTQVWLAISNDTAAKVSGKHFRLKQQSKPNSAAMDEKIQDAYISACEQLSGVKFPA